MGDLLTFASRPASMAHAGHPGGAGVHPGFRPGPRFGLRRGTSATSWYDTGCRLEATKGSDARGAITAYERAVAGCPGLADAHNNLGRLLHDHDSAAAAEGSYRLAICADPGVALYWFNLGVSVEDQGRHAEAVAAYERALELDGQLANAHFNLARLLELKARRIGDDAMLQRAVRHLLRYRVLAKRNARAQ